MKTLQQLAQQLTAIPLSTSWYLSDLGEARGKQELFTKQAPQRLKVLREHALIESAISSNRIEGVVIDQSRVGTVVFGKSRLRDRSEEEIRGYRKALQLIHEQGAKLPVSEATILRLTNSVTPEQAMPGSTKPKIATSSKLIPTVASACASKP